MHTVLGLSLTSDDVAWALVDATDGTVIDHDALEWHGDSEIADSAARSAHAIATACGFDIDRVRITWTAEAGREGLLLRTRLRRLGFGDIQPVPMACATKVLIDPEKTSIAPRLALAYGAAMAIAGPSEAVSAPVTQRFSARGRLSRRRLVSAGLGVAAAVALGIVCLSAGAAPQFHPPSVTAEGDVPSGAGWATVPVPSGAAVARAHKVVETPSSVESPSTAAVQTYVPVRAVAPTAANPIPAPTAVPHLSGAFPAAGPVPGVTDSTPAAAPEPDIADVVDALVALP
ncbi:MAG: hypothetical protein K0U76_05745 [Actinomycetia bacterium]|nr:hypothetical protein [Actinomycetes bacterium]